MTKRLLVILAIILAITACSDPIVIIRESGDESFRFTGEADIIKTYGDRKFTNPIVALHKSSGDVVYSSTNEKVATVDSETGEVTIKGTGTSTINAVTDKKIVGYTLLVVPAKLTVYADDIKMEGSLVNQPVFTYTIDGFVYDEDETVLAGSPKFDTTYDHDKYDEYKTDTHSFPLNISQGTLSAANYDFIFVGGRIGINLAEQAPLTINGGNITKTWGDDSFQLHTSGGTGGGDIYYRVESGSNIVKINGDYVEILNVGTANVYAHKMADDNNYSIDSPSITITIGKRNISNADIDVHGSFTFEDGKDHKPIPEVTDYIWPDFINNWITSSDYEVSYPSDDYVGNKTTETKVKLTITAASDGHYTGSKDLEYTINASGFTVTFNSNGGTAIAEQTGLKSGEKITEPEAPTKAGHIFKGWYNNAGLTGSAWNFTTGTVIDDMTLYARFVLIIFLELELPAGSPGYISPLPTEKTMIVTLKDSDGNIISAAAAAPGANLAVSTSTPGFSLDTSRTTLTYNTTQEFPSGSANIAFTVSNVSYELDASSSTKTVSLRDGKATAANRQILINQSNYAAFQTYNVPTSGSYSSASFGLDRHYLQTEDIILSVGVNNWNSIGCQPGSASAGMKLTGSYDGAGKTITNMKMNTGNNYGGMFNTIGGTGIVKNVHLMNIDIQGTSYVGGIAKTNEGTIEFCSVNGKITTTDTSFGYAAGIAYSNSTSNSGVGVVRNCYTSVTINAAAGTTGGIVSTNAQAGSIIENCYSIGPITSGGSQVGGIAGSNTGTISNCYSTSALKGTAAMGGISGAGSGKVEYCYSTSSIESTHVNTQVSLYLSGINSNGPVSNSVALNPYSVSIYPTTTVNYHRRVSSSSSCTNNYAREDMKQTLWNGTSPSISKGLNATGGEDLAVNGSKSLSEIFITALNWDTNIWNIPAGNFSVGAQLPTLKTVVHASSQAIPTLPAIP